MVKVFIEREHRDVALDYRGGIRPLLERLGVNPETIIVVKNGQIVTEDESCGADDELKLLSVISGG